MKKRTPESPPSLVERVKNRANRVGRAAMFAGALASSNCEDCEPNKADIEATEQIKKEIIEADVEHPTHEYFDANPEFFRRIQGGEFTKEERAQRMETLANGEKIFHDIGLDFYYVERGDTISEIREKLAKYPQYAHLKDQTRKLESFNIQARDLQAGMWLPIPMETETRIISDEQMTYYALEAIDEIEKTKYAPELARVLEKVSKKELAATIIATARRESGGSIQEDAPIGRCVFHRWERGHKRFSFSAVHTLMKGPGIKARKYLNMTEGQTYHPKNSAKLYLGYMFEKTNIAERYFPVDEHLESMARFYNGAKWEDTNPDYPETIEHFYHKALEEMEGYEWLEE